MSDLVLNSMWVLLASVLVFIMHSGFAMVEVGFTQSKNAVNIIMKNFVTVAFGVVGFYVFGYGIMYGSSYFGIVGIDNFFLTGLENTVAGISGEVFFFFQAIFAATAATIVSGAVAERTKFSSYVVFVIILTCFIYPLIGHLVWGGGLLSSIGFIDFAGGSVVHAVGGISALIGAYLVGPRKGKYSKGEVRTIPGHNIPMAAIGVFLLWFGWFGFNPGSTLDITSSVTYSVAVVTLLGGSAGVVGAIGTSMFKYGKADPGIVLNGALAGLVGVTAGASVFDYTGAIVIGVLSSVVMVYSLEFIDTKLKVDDPVGAITIHGVIGLFGTLMIGLFANTTDVIGLFYGGGATLLLIQATGIVVITVIVFCLSFASLYIIKNTMGLRVDKHHEKEGLDFVEHETSAYANHPRELAKAGS